MKHNIGSIDRTLRILLGLGLIGYGVATHSWIGALGIIPLVTAFLRFCPVYCPLGLSTIGKSDPNDEGGGCCGGGQCG